MRVPRSILPLALLIVVLATAAAFLVAEWRASARSRLLIDHSYAVIDAALALTAAMADAEAAERGFIATGAESAAQPLDAAVAAVPARLAALRGLVADNPEHLRHVEAAASLWDAWQARLAALVAEARTGDAAGARAALAGEAGRAMADVRAEAARLQAGERQLLAERLAEGDRRRDRLGLAIGAVLVLAGLGMAASVLVLSRRTTTLARDVSSQRQIARSLEEATFELAGQVSTVRAELTDTARRFDAALRTAPIVLASQDRELRYRWMRNSLLGQPAEWFIGRTDAELMPEPARSRMIAAKEETLRSGEPRDFEIFLSASGEADGKWYDVHIESTRDDKGSIDGVTSVHSEVTERKRRERHIRLLMRELAHRSKNTLAVTQAMARQTAATAGDMETFLERFADRLEALGRAHTLLVDEGWSGAGIGDMVRAQLGHYADLVGRQVFLDGPAITLPAEMIQNIGLALHELATNAAKYGALSTPDGRVDIAWSAEPGPGGTLAIVMSWRESGGPPVTPPARRGFGQLVIERTVARAVGGEVELDYAPAGLRWTLRFERPPEAGEAPLANGA